MATREDDMVESSDRMKVVIYYAVWATICAAAAGIAVALLHTWFFSYHVGRSGFLQTLVGDIEAALAIAAGSGAVAGLMGSVVGPHGGGFVETLLLRPRLGLVAFGLNFLPFA